MPEKIALDIVNYSADYLLLAVKGNQPKLDNTVERNVPMNKIAVYDGDSYTAQEESHGR
ncbi:hypothetical protein [Nitrincola tibetensis]|uniref:hypothetical protein n=1 Tax=Nitrincola tibetensis TaxID=2219697 RepID=UPI0012E37D08|nr:hypothetical protein [Nitrincola tibetensis]